MWKHFSGYQEVTEMMEFVKGHKTLLEKEKMPATSISSISLPQFFQKPFSHNIFRATVCRGN